MRLQPGPHAVAARIACGCRCDSLNRRKDANTLRILARSYGDINLLFVQVRTAVIGLGLGLGLGLIGLGLGLGL